MDLTNEKELELLMKRVIHDYLKDHLAQLKEINKESNNSFVFLEKSTLNRLINYMISGTGTTSKKQQSIGEIDESQILTQLQQLMDQNKEEFEEVLAMLNNLS